MHTDYKYRIWDHEAETMISWEEAKNFHRLDILLDPSRAYYEYTKLPYTQLRDCNGQEIYDHDIIELHCHPECEGIRAVVKWFHDGWYYFTENEEKGRMAELTPIYGKSNIVDLDFSQNRCEIIGNKFENPNLLDYTTDRNCPEITNRK